MREPTRRSETHDRILSGSILALIGAAALFLGGAAFSAFCAAVAGIIIWEASRLSDSEIRPEAAAALGTGAVCASFAASAAADGGLISWLLIAAPPAIGCVAVRKGRVRFLAAALLTLLSADLLTWIRDELGTVTALWLICTVVAVDVAGYFAGRTFGGPKLAPRLSPGKTWSGAAAGWAAASALGLLFQPFEAHASIPAGLWIAAGAQAGDLGESWYKRSAGVKDSSSLLPGQGGFSDRFDGVAGGCVALWALLAAEAVSGGGRIPLP